MTRFAPRARSRGATLCSVSARRASSAARASALDAASATAPAERLRPIGIAGPRPPPLRTPPQRRIDDADHRQRQRRVPVQPLGEHDIGRPKGEEIAAAAAAGRRCRDTFSGLRRGGERMRDVDEKRRGDCAPIGGQLQSRGGGGERRAVERGTSGAVAPQREQAPARRESRPSWKDDVGQSVRRLGRRRWCGPARRSTRGFFRGDSGRIGRDERVGVVSAHGGIVTDGGALSRAFAAKPPRLSGLFHVR